MPTVELGKGMYQLVASVYWSLMFIVLIVIIDSKLPPSRLGPSMLTQPHSWRPEGRPFWSSSSEITVVWTRELGS